MQMPVREVIPQLVEPPAEAIREILPLFHFSKFTEYRLLCRKKNLFYLVQDPVCGVRAVLRVSGRRRTWGQLTVEALWLNELSRDMDFLVPRVVRCQNGEFCAALSHPLSRGYYGMVFNYANGIPAEMNARTFYGLYRYLGELAAQLHQSAILWSAPGHLSRPTIDSDAVDEALIGELDEAPLFLHALEVIHQRLERFGRSPDRFGLIHADLKPSNLLLDKERMTLLDFDDCGYGWFLYDLASSVSGMETHPLLPKMTNAWMEGYRKYRKISREEANELPTFLLLRRFLKVSEKLCDGHLTEVLLRDTVRMAEEYLLHMPAPKGVCRT